MGAEIVSQEEHTDLPVWTRNVQKITKSRTSDHSSGKPLTLQEKKIYHQIHPAKLITDFGTGFGAVYLLWHEQIILSVLVAFVPSTIVSLYLIAKLDLEKYKNSSFGTYIRRNMASKSDDWIRFFGFLVMLIGGWIESYLLIGVGFLIILLVWTKGLFLPLIRPKKNSP